MRTALFPQTFWEQLFPQICWNSILGVPIGGLIQIVGTPNGGFLLAVSTNLSEQYTFYNAAHFKDLYIQVGPTLMNFDLVLTLKVKPLI